MMEVYYLVTDARYLQRVKQVKVALITAHSAFGRDCPGFASNTLEDVEY